MSAAADGLRQAEFDAATEILRMLTIDGVDSTGDPSLPIVDCRSEAFWGMSTGR